MLSEHFFNIISQSRCFQGWPTAKRTGHALLEVFQVVHPWTAGQFVDSAAHCSSRSGAPFHAAHASLSWQGPSKQVVRCLAAIQ